MGIPCSRREHRVDKMYLCGMFTAILIVWSTRLLMFFTLAGHVESVLSLLHISHNHYVMTSWLNFFIYFLGVPEANFSHE